MVFQRAFLFPGWQPIEKWDSRSKKGKEMKLFLLVPEEGKWHTVAGPGLWEEGL